MLYLWIIVFKRPMQEAVILVVRSLNADVTEKHSKYLFEGAKRCHLAATSVVDTYSALSSFNNDCLNYLLSITIGSDRISINYGNSNDPILDILAH